MQDPDLPRGLTPWTGAHLMVGDRPCVAVTTRRGCDAINEDGVMVTVYDLYQRQVREVGLGWCTFDWTDRDTLAGLVRRVLVKMGATEEDVEESVSTDCVEGLAGYVWFLGAGCGSGAEHRWEAQVDGLGTNHRAAAMVRMWNRAAKNAL